MIQHQALPRPSDENSRSCVRERIGAMRSRIPPVSRILGTPNLPHGVNTQFGRFVNSRCWVAKKISHGGGQVGGDRNQHMAPPTTVSSGLSAKSCSKIQQF
ncbi:MAG: hypothetical protein ACRCU2_01685 [Planktothrix sp.]